MTIPRVIHQTAQSAQIPAAWRRYQQLACDLHPGWSYRFWTDVDNDEFVASVFPDLLQMFRCLPFGIMRADVIRYLILFEIGGLYVDLDYEFFRAFDLLEADCVLPLETEADRPRRLGNALLASSPGHHFFGTVLDDLRSQSPRARSREDVLKATGPLFITRIYEGIPLATRSDILLPERRLFSPTTPRGDREYRALVARGDAYGVHHCHGTWRDFSRLQRTKRRIARLLR